ncbi:MAG: DnaJ domain-containing protein [Hyphomonadaceae bacterium]
MLAIALFVLAAGFAVLALARIAMARRARWGRRLPVFLLGGLAVFLMMRGSVVFAVAMAGFAMAYWVVLERASATAAPAAARSGPMSAMEARTILGVGPGASSADIRAAYRAKMTRAHPDHGGSHEQAARLNAARDLLLKS